jgi:uncharacterized membrane protein
MRFKKYTFFILIVLFTLSACKKGTNPPLPKPVDVDVYVAGYIVTQNSAVASYWQNGQLNKLPGESGDCMANAIAVNGKDVYLAGYVTIPNSKNIAAFWKNGIKTNLPDSALNSKANAIAVNGSDIYIAGYRMFSPGHLTATYWKNGVPVSLPDSLYGSEATAIAVNANDVYIAGYIISPQGHDVASLWKNGVLTNLDNSGLISKANAIAINGSDIYIAGVSGANAVYWKNGLATKLRYDDTHDDATSVGAGASAIAINGTDVYIAGGTYNNNGSPIAIYWKNGVGIRVPNSTQVSQTPNDLSISQARGIAINGNDVYVSGFNLGGQAVYWKNGTTVQLGFGSSNGGGILLLPR